MFCDLTKAFDTVSHNILLDKLFVYGIRGNAHNWFKSYLAHRKQCTSFNNVSSPYTLSACGVPQGSILGPILFLIYINDIIHSSNKLKFLLFADDTTIFIQGHDLEDITDTLNTELINVSNWIMSNKLTLNINKTKFMISSPLTTQPVHTSIKINNFALNVVTDFKFLGITIDNKLKWKQHIDMVKSKVALLTGVIYRLRDCLNQNSLRQIYLSLIYPHLLYCCAIWGGAYNTFIDSLIISQKKLLRVMFFKDRYAHTNCIFRDFRLLKLPDIIYLQTNLFVHKALHSFPVYPGFTVMPHSVTRRTHQLRLPLCRSTHAQQSVLSRGSKNWNNLPQSLLNNDNLVSFKRNLFSLLHGNYT